ncbi:uncharacterized protein CLUP02_04177 [Colletotrichum lupini]|uniref:Uncharacterized protein n=1 Tax=Colletotrichum lupini TaxID=145971 RepID=A0A9Q8SKQ4_9PEZI|nr:uncharacterized protein CLUP02_04177 [Colletotrichum lupini]UQC78700.1 hypothetical protein CLUP02_04177 [Colletotrichum lupini]
MQEQSAEVVGIFVSQNISTSFPPEYVQILANDVHNFPLSVQESSIFFPSTNNSPPAPWRSNFLLMAVTQRRATLRVSIAIQWATRQIIPVFFKEENTVTQHDHTTAHGPRHDNTHTAYTGCTEPRESGTPDSKAGPHTGLEIRIPTRESTGDMNASHSNRPPLDLQASFPLSIPVSLHGRPLSPKISAASSSVATQQISIVNTSESRTTALVSGRRLIQKSWRYWLSLLNECSCFNHIMGLARRSTATLCDGFFDAMSKYPGMATQNAVSQQAPRGTQAKGSNELAFARFTTVDAQDRLMLPQPALPCCINPYDCLIMGMISTSAATFPATQCGHPMNIHGQGRAHRGHTIANLGSALATLFLPPAPQRPHRVDCNLATLPHATGLYLVFPHLDRSLGQQNDHFPIGSAISRRAPSPPCAGRAVVCKKRRPSTCLAHEEHCPLTRLRNLFLLIIWLFSQNFRSSMDLSSRMNHAAPLHQTLGATSTRRSCSQSSRIFIPVAYHYPLLHRNRSNALSTVIVRKAVREPSGRLRSQDSRAVYSVLLRFTRLKEVRRDRPANILVRGVLYTSILPLSTSLCTIKRPVVSIAFLNPPFLRQSKPWGPAYSVGHDTLEVRSLTKFCTVKP